MEIWKDISGYEGLYQVSNLGNVRSLSRICFNSKKKIIKEKMLKPVKDSYGYLVVVLSKEAKHKTFKIHRLVGQTFIPNPEDKPTINHKNGIKTDNRVENLEWATNKEQTHHCMEVLNHKFTISDKCRINSMKNRLKKVRRSDGATFNSVKEASNGNKNLERSIGFACRGKIKSAGGYKWEYI